jgi:hypothetical protein
VDNGEYFLFFAGTALGNYEQVGPTDRHMLLNAQSSQGKAMYTISLSPANGARFFGMHILTG